MGRLKYLRIKLDNPSGVYFGGNVVTGTVSLGLDGDGKKARGVRVEIKGESKVHWTERRTRGTGENRRTETVHHRSNEIYVNHRVYLVGDGNNSMQITAGDYEYPFRLQLPENIPSSFVGEYGRIVYNIKAVVDRPWRFDHETVAFFTVDGIYDLNREPSASSPRSLSDHKMLGFLCCQSGPVSATIQTDRSGYVPGERIYLQATADNKADRVMNKTTVKLIQTITFHAGGRTKVCETTVLEATKGSIPAGESDSWHDTALKIPVLPPSELPHCNNIHIRYIIEFRVDPSGIGFDLKLELPIVIGTIPLRSTFNSFRPSPSSDTPTAPLLPAKPDLPPAFSDYSELPPPTYEEAMGDDLSSMKTEDENEHVNGNWNFRPQYPSYGWK